MWSKAIPPQSGSSDRVARSTHRRQFYNARLGAWFPWVYASPQTDESRICASEAAGTVEVAQVRLVIHVDPLHTTLARGPDGTADQRPTDAAPAKVRADGGLEEEGVDATALHQPHEVNQLVASVGAI